MRNPHIYRTRRNTVRTVSGFIPAPTRRYPSVYAQSPPIFEESNLLTNTRTKNEAPENEMPVVEREGTGKDTYLLRHGGRGSGQRPMAILK